MVLAAAEKGDMCPSDDPVSLLQLLRRSETEGQIDMFEKEQRGEGTYYGAGGDSGGACEDHRTGGDRALWGHNAITVAINKPQWCHQKGFLRWILRSVTFRSHFVQRVWIQLLPF